MEKEKIIEFDFKKIIPIEIEVKKKISSIITKKFLLIAIMTSFFGMGWSFTNHIYNNYKTEEVIKAKQEYSDFLIAQQNKEDILTNLENQSIMYDDIIKDIIETNKKIPNLAQVILTQTNQIRDLSQTHKENMAKIINNFNKITQSDDSFKNATTDEKEMFFKSVSSYQIGSLNRNSDLENVLMSYTTVANDEHKIGSVAQDFRDELKPKVIDKISNLLGNNDLTKFKKFKTK